MSDNNASSSSTAQRSNTKGRRRNAQNKVQGPDGNNKSIQSIASVHSGGAPPAQQAIRAPRPPPRMPEPGQITATLQNLMDAVHQLRTQNAELSEGTGRALTNIERRFQAIANDKGLKAASIMNFSPEAILAAMGKDIPCDTIDKAIAMMMDVMYNNGHHPVRVGVRGLSKFLKNQTSTIFKIPNGGVDGYQLGDAIAVAFPVHAAHRGAAIIALHTDGTYNVLAYAKPNRDLQRTGATIIALYSSLALSAPSAITGTNVAVTAQLFLALGNFACAPMMILPKNPGPLSQDGAAHARTIGPEEHVIHQFNATESLEAVSTYSCYDTINSDIAVAVQPDVQSFSNTSTYASPSRPYILAATANSADAAKACGFTPAVQAAFGSYLLLPANTDVVIHNTIDDNDDRRHMKQGDVEVSGSLTVTPDVGGSHTTYLYVDVQYDIGAGVTETFTEQFAMSNDPGAVGTISFYFNTRGPSRARTFDGYLIRNISFRLRSLTYPSQLNTTAEYFPKICVKYLDVPSTTRYIVGIFNNVNPGNSIAIDQKAQVEGLIDPTAEDAKFLEVGPVMPYQPDILPGIIRVHAETATSTKQRGALEAASFRDTFRKILKAGGKIGMNGLKGAASSLLHGGDPLSGALQGMTSSSFGSGTPNLNYQAPRRIQRGIVRTPDGAGGWYLRLGNAPLRDEDRHLARQMERLQHALHIPAGYHLIRLGEEYFVEPIEQFVDYLNEQPEGWQASSFADAPIERCSMLEDLWFPGCYAHKFPRLRSAHPEFFRQVTASDFQSPKRDDFGHPTGVIGKTQKGHDDIDAAFDHAKCALAAVTSLLLRSPEAAEIVDQLISIRDSVVVVHSITKREVCAPSRVEFSAAPIGPPPKFFFTAVRSEPSGVSAWAVCPVVRAPCSDLELNSVFPRGELGNPSKEITGRSNTGAIFLANLARLGFPVIQGGNFSFEVTGISITKDPYGSVSGVNFTMLPVDHSTDKLAASRLSDMPLTGLFREGFYKSGVLTPFNPTFLFPGKSLNVTYSKVPLEPPFPRETFGYTINVSRTKNNDN